MPGNEGPSKDNWDRLPREWQAALGTGVVALLLFPSALPFAWYVSAALSIGVSAAAALVTYVVVRRRSR